MSRFIPGLFLLSILLLGAVTGCAANSGLVSPTATVESVRVVDQSATGTSLEVIVRMENPNSVSLPLPSVQFSLIVEGLGQFSFTDTPRVTLPAKRTDGEFGPGLQFLKLPAAIKTDGKDARGAPYRANGSIVYEPPGEIRKLLTESNVPLPTMNFSHSGTVE